MSKKKSKPARKKLSNFTISPLGAIRRAAGISQSDVAHMLVHGTDDGTPGPMAAKGCHRSAYSGMERGRYQIDGAGYGVNIVPFLSQIFGVPESKIMTAWKKSKADFDQRRKRGEIQG